MNSPSAPMRRILLVHLMLFIGSACSPAPEPAVAIGEPLPGLTDGERTSFEAGLVLFNRVYTAADGLGPFFNENQCAACHTDPAAGGTGEQSVVRASHFEAPDRCDLLPDVAGDNVQRNTTPALRARGVERREEPAAATERGLLRVPFLFGLGLVEAIPEETILGNADPEDADGDGISGRPGRDGSGRLTRFGRKAEHPSIESFTAGAFLLEMGLTSPLNPEERLLDGVPYDAEVDPSPDPEVSGEDLAAVADFVRFLAPPSRRQLEADEEGLVEDGERLFDEIGCARCHVAEMRTGRSEVRALDRKVVRLYSDLLLHDMGPELSGFCGAAASPSEWRTEPLMGVRYRERFLHDGRAYDLFAAISLHGGEAAAARDAFERLDRVTQESIIRFLGTL